jgi:hypothetical protein
MVKAIEDLSSKLELEVIPVRTDVNTGTGSMNNLQMQIVVSKGQFDMSFSEVVTKFSGRMDRGTGSWIDGRYF